MTGLEKVAATSRKIWIASASSRWRCVRDVNAGSDGPLNMPLSLHNARAIAKGFLSLGRCAHADPHWQKGPPTGYIPSRHAPFRPARTRTGPKTGQIRT
nr:hypothetical protein SHINE37_80039 [Rhizobiaceae bacterium]